MNVYHWITIIFLADIALIAFVCGADSRRNERAREHRQMEAQQ